MDTTEQRGGFRLPWTERREQGEHDGGPDEPADAGEGAVVDVQMTGSDIPETDAGAPQGDPGAPDHDAVADAPIAADGHGRQSRFLADLTRAMHAAAEEGRQSALEQFHADGKRTVEEIQSRSADEAAAIRRGADEDVAGVREWSKAEIARIREETEHRIAERKAYLDRQLEGHAAVVEREIERVQELIVGYDTQMTEFFDALLGEPDPGRFAALAASLPEPPPFTPLSDEERHEIEARALAGPAALEEPPVEAEAEAPADQAQAQEAAAAPEVVPTDMPAPDGGAVEGVAEAQGDDGTGSAEIDARLAALGDLAEAERAARADVSPDEAALASHGASLSARLAGLVMPVHAEGVQQAAPVDGPAVMTQVVVTGLTSVASIAAFKRQLGRLEGVRSVAVSSGPSEEFVFAVSHVGDRPLADGIASLTGFAPRIDRVEAGEIHVAARDPES
jgi:hypothetical protein